MSVIDNAYEIAKRVLKSSYRENGIVAGSGQWEQVWARDSCFASLGALALGDRGVVRRNLETLLKAQAPDGQIPLRIGHDRRDLALKILGIRVPPAQKPVYLEDKLGHHARDSNPLLVICASEFAQGASADEIEFLRRNIGAFESAVRWSLENDVDDDLLIEERAFSTWADNVRKEGKVLYSNVCHCHALECLFELELAVGNWETAARYQKLHVLIKERINQEFWNGSFYTDWIDWRRTSTHFTTDGNLLAMLWGIASEDQAYLIQASMRRYRIADPVPCRTNSPRISLRDCFTPLIFLAGLTDYHNGSSWTWLGCVDAVVKHRFGQEAEAQAVLEKIAQKAVEEETFLELYDRKGRPYRKLFYRAERNFAWSAGLFVWACRELA